MNTQTTTTRSVQKIYIDATSYRQSDCLFRLDSIINDGYREKGESSALAYGQAIHKFVASLRSDKVYGKAISVASIYYNNYLSKNPLHEKDFRTIEHLMLACTLYYEKVYTGDIFQTIVSPIDNKTHLIEQRFEFPAIEIFPNLEKYLQQVYELYNIEVWICGTIDEIGIIESGNVLIKDIKTMSCGAYYAPMNLSGYRLSTQLMFYKLIVEHKLKLPNVSCFIEAFVTEKKDYKITFAKSDIFDYSEEQMRTFKSGLSNTISAYCYYLIQGGEMPKNYCSCQNNMSSLDKAGKCFMFDICATDDEALREHYINKNLTKRQYNPMLFGEE